MKRGSKFLIGFAAAVLTYAGLMLFVSPHSMGYGRFHAFENGKYMHCERNSTKDAGQAARNTPRQGDSSQTHPKENND